MASPSEFLTFYRRVATSSRALRMPLRTTLRPASARPFSLSSQYQKDYPADLSTNSKTSTDGLPDDKHSQDKANDGDTLDIQSANLKAAQDAKQNDAGGQATEEKDSAGGVAKAKKEFPEAPDPAIGMQDERGGRGG